MFVFIFSIYTLFCFICSSVISPCFSAPPLEEDLVTAVPAVSNTPSISDGEEAVPAVPTITLTPSVNQVVFEGDELPLKCYGSPSGQDGRIIWLHEDTPLDPSVVGTRADEAERNSTYLLEESQVADKVASRLTIKSLQVCHRRLTPRPLHSTRSLKNGI